MSGIDETGTATTTTTTTTSDLSSSQAAAASKFQTDCLAEHRASLDCISANYDTKHEACAQFFERYKECRKAENERRLEANKLRFWGS